MASINNTHSYKNCEVDLSEGLLYEYDKKGENVKTYVLDEVFNAFAIAGKRFNLTIVESSEIPSLEDVEQ
ncbi:YonK family protein [Ureibacillus chungkukjangi]|uniref:YonK family protein n=1 Tax=Ureibacillus chungkukjangi TaxID=1202712 RepID=UPI002041D8A9|nr:YonK family protein [Ureibacillus chungkukjangi]MCM3387316.1 YonK family protein [Ureibacillus chungkukjangi]